MIDRYQTDPTILCSHNAVADYETTSITYCYQCTVLLLSKVLVVFRFYVWQLWIIQQNPLLSYLRQKLYTYEGCKFENLPIV